MAIEIADLETYKGFQSKLKSEAGKIKASGYFVLFDKYKFKDADKPLLLVLPKKDTGLEKFITTKGSKAKASGTCEGSDKGLIFNVTTGALRTQDVKSFGISGHVAGDEEDEVPEKVKAEDTESKGGMTEGTTPSEGKQEPPKGTWTRAKPTEERPEPKMQLGSAAEEKRQVEAYIKNRTDLVEFAKQYLTDMDYFFNRTKAVVQQSGALVQRADGGERSPALENSIDAALHNAEEIKTASQGTYDTKGEHLAKERTVKAINFIKNAKLAEKVAQENKSLFEEVTVISKKTSELNRDINLELTEAIRSLKLMQSLVKTGKPDLKDLLEYLDGVLESLSRPMENLRKGADVDSPTKGIQFLLTDTKGTKESKTTTMNQWKLNVESKDTEVREAMDQIQRLCKFGLNRLKSGPQNHTEIKSRFEKFKQALADATSKKRDFVLAVRTFEGEVSKLEETLKG
jgi:hypothetical protein